MAFNSYLTNDDSGDVGMMGGGGRGPTRSHTDKQVGNAVDMIAYRLGGHMGRALHSAGKHQSASREL